MAYGSLMVLLIDDEMQFSAGRPGGYRVVDSIFK